MNKPGSRYFTDPDGDTLSYDVTSRSPTTVRVSVEGTLLTMTSGETPGASEIEVRSGHQTPTPPRQHRRSGPP